MTHKIFVGNLSWDSTEDDLKALFEQFGEIVSVKIIQDRDTGRSRGFGFVEMNNRESCEQAIQKLDSSDYMGRPLKVNFANEQEARPARSFNNRRSEGGNGGGGNYRSPSSTGGNRDRRGGSGGGGRNSGNRSFNSPQYSYQGNSFGQDQDRY